MALPVRRPRPGELRKLLRVAEPDVQHVAVELPIMRVQRGVQARVKDSVAVEFVAGDIAGARHRKLAPCASVGPVHPPTSGAAKLTITTSHHPYPIRIHLPRYSIQLSPRPAPAAE